MGSDACSTTPPTSTTDFNPRSPDGERPGLHHLPAKVQNISIHAPRMGSDMRRANSSPRRPISIHAPRMGSDLPGARGHLRRGQISIHAPRMGSDAVFAMPQVWWRISIHAPRMGSDRKGNRLRSRHSKFQSTLPGWGATGVLFEHIQAHNHFNPRSPDGERP